MKRLFLFLALCCLLNAATTEQRINEFLPKFEQYIQSTMADWAIPGVAIAIVTPNKVLLCKGFGVREVGKNKPVNQHTIFQIASLTKNFTAALAGILEAKKVFSLNDLAKKYLPNFKLANQEVTNKATLQDLMSHRIGIDGFAGDTLMKFGLQPQEIIERFALLPFNLRFREDYTYSNQMYGFMGVIMENAAKKKFSELFRQFINEPLGLYRTSVGDDLINTQKSLWNKFKEMVGKDENIAFCHDRDLEGKAVCIGLDSLMYVFPSTTGVNTTAHDLGIWLQCHLNDGTHNHQQIIPENHIKAMRQALVSHNSIRAKDMQFPSEVMKNVSYGMGWFSYDYGMGDNTLQIFEHMGGFSGQRSLIFMCPSQGFAVAILANLGNFNLNLYPEALRNVFLDFCLNLEHRDWSTEYATRKKEYYKRIYSQRLAKKLTRITPKHDNKFYLGTYTNPLYGEFTISEKNNELQFNANQRSCKIEHWNGDEFNLNGWEFSGNMSRSDPNYIEFGQDEKGQILSYVSFLHEGANPVFVKKNP